MTTTIKTTNVDSALLNLEGIIHALNLVRRGDALDKPGPEFHALSVLVTMAVTQVEKVRLAIYPTYPNDASEPAPPCREAAPC